MASNDGGSHDHRGGEGAGPRDHRGGEGSSPRGGEGASPRCTGPRHLSGKASLRQIVVAPSSAVLDPGWALLKLTWHSMEASCNKERRIIVFSCVMSTLARVEQNCMSL